MRLVKLLTDVILWPWYFNSGYDYIETPPAAAISAAPLPRRRFLKFFSYGPNTDPDDLGGLEELDSLFVPSSSWCHVAVLREDPRQFDESILSTESRKTPAKKEPRGSERHRSR